MFWIRRMPSPLVAFLGLCFLIQELPRKYRYTANTIPTSSALEPGFPCLCWWILIFSANGLVRKFIGKPHIFLGKSWVSCRFPLKPLHWHGFWWGVSFFGRWFCREEKAWARAHFAGQRLVMLLPSLPKVGWIPWRGFSIQHVQYPTCSYDTFRSCECIYIYI